ncbi:MAG: invasion associated locus B family protein [Pseudolabrys sp.]|nr:invasion associated locus B family protein [Pseudolabrys sp.]
MIERIATARPFGCALATAVAVTFALATAPAALAQQPAAPAQAPAAKPAAPAKPAAAPKAAPATPAKPAAQAQPAPAAPAAPNGQQAAAEQPQLIYSPWVKICNKGDAAQNQKPVCVTAKDGRLENGMPVAAIALIEPEGETRKLIRVTVPLGMQLQHGTRMIVDTDTPMTAPYFLCFPNGCMADYEAGADVVGKMKKGKQLTIQAINMNGSPISLPLPLADFAKAYDGPPTDPKVLEEQQRKLQEELQKKAEEARKKMEAQQPSAAAPAAPKQ